jgi:hypothetical protein
LEKVLDYFTATHLTTSNQSDSGGVNSIVVQELFIEFIQFGATANVDAHSLVLKSVTFQTTIEIWMEDDGCVDPQSSCSKFK